MGKQCTIYTFFLLLFLVIFQEKKTARPARATHNPSLKTNPNFNKETEINH